MPAGSPHLCQDPPPGAFGREQGSAGTAVSVRSPLRTITGPTAREEAWACVRAERVDVCGHRPQRLCAPGGERPGRGACSAPG